MWRTVCKFISLLTAFALLLGCLAGCGGESPAEKKARLLFEKGIITANNITIESREAARPEDSSALYFDAQYFAIDGLKDQAVEDRINQRIFDVMDEMCQGVYLPPYRGITVKIKQYGDLVQTLHIYVTPEFNGNNILSVSAACYVWFTAENGSTDFSYSYVAPMNFDLSTGEEMTLQDFFPSRKDYLELINLSVDEGLMQGGFDGEHPSDGNYINDLAVVSPFQSISPDQKFLISGNGDLRLFFDYDTPEFFVEFHPCELTISSDKLDGALNLFRFSGEQLCEGDETNCFFAARYDEKPVYKTEWTGERCSFYGRYKYLEGTPEAGIHQAESLTFDKERLPVSEDEIRQTAAKKIGGKKQYNLTVDVRNDVCYSKSQDYFSYIRQTNYYVDTWTETDPDTDNFNAVYTTAFCFDSSGKRLDYRSLFNHPESADKLIKVVIVQNLEEEKKYASVKWTEEQAQNLLETLLPHLNGAALQTDSLSLSYDIPYWEIYDMITDCLGEMEDGYSVMEGISRINYRDLGCENLVFFKDAFE